MEKLAYWELARFRESLRKQDNSRFLLEFLDRWDSSSQCEIVAGIVKAVDTMSRQRPRPPARPDARTGRKGTAKAG